MRPILYSAAETFFRTNGIGTLSDAEKCNVVTELNGRSELTLQYPLNGIHRKDIVRRSIILAKPDPLSKPQPFRVYRVTPSSNGTLKAYARHIAYDLMGITVSPYAAVGVVSALAAIPGNATTDCPFTFWTDKTSSSAFNWLTPRSAWKLLGGEAGSILDIYGGEYEFDGYTVRLWNRRGADRGVQIRYGKNLTSLEQDENCANCYTAIHPYWTSTYDTSMQLVQLPERIVNAPGTYDHTSILPVDFSTEWMEAPTEEQLRARAEAYIADNNIGTPDVSLSVQFLHLDQTEEYKDVAILERVALGDTCDVFFPDMSITASSRVVVTDYDVLRDSYNSVTIGKIKSNIAQTIAQQSKDLEQTPSLSTVQRISMQLTARIIGAKGGAVRLLDTDGDGLPDELYIADNKDPAQALKVWRFNYEGWAASSSGYNGQFILGATLEDGILAHAITAANLVAGTIQSADGSTFFLDLDNGVLRGNFSELSIDSQLVKDMIENQGTSIRQDTESIVLAVRESSVQRTEYTEYQESVAAELKALADQIVMQFSATKASINNLDSNMQSQFAEIYKHITFDLDGITIGAGENAIKMNLDNDQLVFYKGTAELVRLDVNDFRPANITMVGTGSRLTLGNFAWEVLDDGAPALMKVGG